MNYGLVFIFSSVPLHKIKVSRKIKKIHDIYTLSIKFYLKAIKSNNNDFVVNTQIIYNRTKSEFTTGLRCGSNDWNNAKEEFVKNSIFNQQLSNLKSKIFRVKNQLDESGVSYNASEIKKHLLGTEQSDDTLLAYFDQF